MPIATNGAVGLHYEVTGRGAPLVFLHEFAGDARAWDLVVRLLSRRYRCITYNARGYPPSDVPTDPAQYSPALAIGDVVAVMAHAGVASAHLVGATMGGYTALRCAIERPELVRSLVLASTAAGSPPEHQAEFRRAEAAVADMYERGDGTQVADAHRPERPRLREKDPRTAAEFFDRLAQHSAIGAALTLRGIQVVRPSIWDMQAELRRTHTPTLVVVGDEDEFCLESALFLKQNLPQAKLLVLPKAGYGAYLEEPISFSQGLDLHVSGVELGSPC